MSVKQEMISINTLGEILKVGSKTFSAPDGKQITQPVWNKENYLEGLKLLEQYQDPDCGYTVTNSPAPWLTVAYAYELGKRSRYASHYQYPAPPTPQLAGWDVDLSPLAVGEQENNYHVVCEVIEDGENVYLNLNSDDPNADMSKFAGPHTFNPDDLPKVLIPELPKGKNIFFHAKGMFCVMVRVAMSYADDCKSLSIAAHDDDYTCAISNGAELQVGDETKRTIPNNL